MTSVDAILFFQNVFLESRILKDILNKFKKTKIHTLSNKLKDYYHDSLTANTVTIAITVGLFIVFAFGFGH